METDSASVGSGTLNTVLTWNGQGFTTTIDSVDTPQGTVRVPSTEAVQKVVDAITAGNKAEYSKYMSPEALEALSKTIADGTVPVTSIYENGKVTECALVGPDSNSYVSMPSGLAFEIGHWMDERPGDSICMIDSPLIGPDTPDAHVWFLMEGTKDGSPKVREIGRNFE